MTATVAIVIEGVLMREVGDAVITQGQRLYWGLMESYKVALITDDTDVEPVQHWLKVNGFNKHPYLIPAHLKDPEDEGQRRLKQISRLRQAGCNVELVIEPNPQIAAYLMAHGIGVLNYLHPNYSNPRFRPDYQDTVTPWSELVGEVERQRALREEDPRQHMEIL
ncbi:hypothetical protein EV284_3474 [Streptomyces sp. BK022]|uniref:hypothetical protein n=1 Tax=Streptomyces sp. BK022 TaxID=2512123 RepID=UPI00102A32F8|nr:hypothetical protein [Streptomyces sp. BK022]RZU35991.1 hypothetical protein EV284_3474 [Streptomyces sp. BK022]